MKTIPVNFVGGENKSRSKFWGSESTINFYTDYQQTGRTDRALLPWPGEKAFSPSGASNSRGMTCHNGLVYIVSNNDLIEISSTGSRTTKGTIPGSGRCSFSSDGTNLVIRTGAATYLYNTSLSLITDSDLENAQTAAYLNNQFIYQGIGGRFCVSDAGAPASINGLNYATAETTGDSLVQVYSFKERIYLGGTESIEMWYNSGVGNPPFDRVQQSSVNLGVASPFSMANSQNYLYFVGSDKLVYRMSAYQPESITTSSIAKELRESDLSDAQGYLVKLDGQTFYVIQLTTSNKTFAVSENTGDWIRLQTGVDSNKHLINGYCYAYGKHLILDDDTGSVFEWDFDTHESNSTKLIRQRDSAPINGAQLGHPGKRLIFNRFELIMETGVGNSDVSDPEVMISGSIDGGRSWFNEDWVKIGRDGESVKRVEWYDVRGFYDLIIRVRISDPSFIGIHGASIDVKLDGW